MLASCQRLRPIVSELPNCLCADVISTCVWLRLREQCLRSKITSVARVEIVLLLRFVAGNVDVNTLASKCSELIGNADILRMRRVIHNNSTCVCLRIPVAAITQKRKNASVDLWPALNAKSVKKQRINAKSEPSKCSGLAISRHRQMYAMIGVKLRKPG